MGAPAGDAESQAQSQGQSGLGDLSGAFYPIGSGDNLLEFRVRWAVESCAGEAAASRQDSKLSRGNSAASVQISTCEQAVIHADNADSLERAENAGLFSNLLQKRVLAVKEWYKEIRTYLHIDDAIRITGYITQAEGLALTFIDVSTVSGAQSFKWTLTVHSCNTYGEHKVCRSN